VLNQSIYVMQNYKDITRLEDLPFNFLVRTSEGNWGKGETVKEALNNANFHGNFNTQIVLSALNPDCNVFNDGAVSYQYGVNDPKSFKLSDFVTPETLLETAKDLLANIPDAMAKRIANDLEDFLYEHQVNRPCTDKPSLIPEKL
jgi:hypothetical protein